VGYVCVFVCVCMYVWDMCACVCLACECVCVGMWLCGWFHTGIVQYLLFVCMAMWALNSSLCTSYVPYVSWLAANTSFVERGMCLWLLCVFGCGVAGPCCFILFHIFWGCIVSFSWNTV